MSAAAAGLRGEIERTDCSSDVSTRVSSVRGVRFVS